MPTLLERLSNASGVSGNEGEVRDILIQATRNLADQQRTDTMGNLTVFKKARGTRARSVPKVMVAAHMDEVGLLIVHHESNGQLRFRKHPSPESSEGCDLGSGERQAAKPPASPQDLISPPLPLEGERGRG